MSEISSTDPHAAAQSQPLHLAIALDGAGWHPAAWREPSARPTELFNADYWLDLVRDAERGLADFVTIEDSFGLQANHFAPDNDRTDQVRGRLDAVLIADRVAPLTQHIGLIPTALVTHTEPFHISKSIATLDYVSTGRAGVRIQVSAIGQEAAHFGRRNIPVLTAPDLTDPAVQQLVSELFGEAEDFVEVIRRLWDSWEDDAEIRDAATGRFIDRDKIHYIDFVGSHFSVKGPGIVPRPPQGQPSGHGTRARNGSVPVRRPQRGHRIRDADRHRRRPADRRRDPQRAGRRRPGRRDHYSCSPTSWSSSTRPRNPAPSAKPDSTSGPAVSTPAMPESSPDRPANSPICSRIGRPSASPAIACDPAPSRMI